MNTTNKSKKSSRKKKQGSKTAKSPGGLGKPSTSANYQVGRRGHDYDHHDRSHERAGTQNFQDRRDDSRQRYHQQNDRGHGTKV